MPLALDRLLAGFNISAPAIQLNDMQLDTRLLKQGSLFLALKGHAIDGRLFMQQAEQSGAVAILFDNSDGFIAPMLNIPCIAVPSLAEKVSELAGLFYDQPAEKLALVGVTGTNGKSTCTQLIANWTQLLGQRGGVLGTLGNGLFGQLRATENTTGSAISIQQELAHFVTEHVDVAAMEVSSHGLVQHRVSALPFAAAVFTNLSRDHLDYHHTMQAYAEAKRQIFKQTTPAHCILNADDETAREWLQQMPQAVVYGIDQQLPNHTGSFLYATDVKYHPQGITISIHSSWGDGVLSAPLLGKFNVSNLLAALAVMLVLQYDFETLCQTASRLQPVTGRMECFGNSQQPLVVVDYAHTPDGLEKALQAARQHCHGRLFCIFGCGGDRDRGKRPQMTAIAEQWADTIILTDDNPRTEDPAVIIADMCAGLQKPAQAHIEHSRTRAIELALSQAVAGDIILVAGKGHEDYQIVGKEKRHYSDRETVMQLLGATS
nr:UDP-N-acetylmuramoyl-L-alanyl-D-glutamate--2,6-diaminopimelate ligase [uncultured Tolumonas sp.]